MAYRVEPRTSRTVSVGEWLPQGATPKAGGVNFALYSQYASAVYLVLFDRAAGPPTDVIRVENCTRRVWHCFVHGLRAGQLYGYRVEGPWNPRAGMRFNPAKLLVDPYAKALGDKAVNADDLLLGYDAAAGERDLALDERDNAHVAPKAIVVDDAFDWAGDARPAIPLEKLFVYEVHARGFTAHASSRVRHPGSYLGFVEKIPYLERLGVNAVELLPVHECYVEDFLRGRGLTNYWGYNTLGFFAPDVGYSTRTSPGCQVAEFKTLVRELHRAGIEVILDVVYNHTAEGSELGPTISFRGVDNPTYYVLTGPDGERGRYYENWTGCGNCLDLSHPQVLRLVMDSLRYWVEVMHVDGFRFDLASVLGREGGGFQQTASFFAAVSQDPVLERVKLVAEPWDLATYQVGNFPIDWSEWNGRFRDTLRKFGKGDGGQAPELGWRLTGSADLYGDDGRSAFNSVNFITCHDGFTLWDLVSYGRKQNEANREDNRDGTDDNQSWNCGEEGETGDPEVLALRRRLARNHLAHLLFSLGTPLLLGGDEFLRTQGGNNNAYCQDNAISWFDWSRAEANADMVDFVRKVIAVNKRCTILHRRKFYGGEDANGNHVPGIRWFGIDGGPLDWRNPELRTVVYMLDGSEEPSELGDYRLLFILNADHRLQRVTLPPPGGRLAWYRVIDTSLPPGAECAAAGEEVPVAPADAYLVNGRSTVLLIGR